MGIPAWASNVLAEATGASDWLDIWTPLQFDAVASQWGTYIENKLNQFDPKTGKALYSLQDLLDDRPRTLQTFMQRFAQFPGVMGAVRHVGRTEHRQG